jgi:hypothetical protein
VPQRKHNGRIIRSSFIPSLRKGGIFKKVNHVRDNNILKKATISSPTRAILPVHSWLLCDAMCDRSLILERAPNLALHAASHQQRQKKKTSYGTYGGINATQTDAKIYPLSYATHASAPQLAASN